MNKPQITVVTPAYNAAAHLHKLYQCMCSQTYAAWQWVIVDDASTDDTASLVAQWTWQDPRVVMGQMPRNSGNARIPRYKAVEMADADYVVCVDADDLIADDYLQLMWARHLETGAEVVYPVMRFVDKVGKVMKSLPEQGFDTEKLYEGRELVIATMPFWKIGCNGGLYRKALWLEAVADTMELQAGVNEDEVDERRLLIAARRVAFATAQYDYVQHSRQITAGVRPRSFERLDADAHLCGLIEQHFGRKSREYAAMHRLMLYDWRSGMADFMRHYAQLQDAEPHIMQQLAAIYGMIDCKSLPKEYRRRFFLLRNHRLMSLFFSAKYAPLWMLEKVCQRLFAQPYLWFVQHSREENRLKKQVMVRYSPADDYKVTRLETIVMCQGFVAHGGLIDRLRGAVSVYMACKKHKKNFKLWFTHPFELRRYLVPARYDWTISEEKISYSTKNTEVLLVDTVMDNDWERCYQQTVISQRVRECTRQLHVYTNAACCYNQDFAAAFAELFKPAPELQKHIDEVLGQIGGAYVSVSARFMNLMGDFNEQNFSVPLSEDRREQLLQDCERQLQRLLHEFPDHRLLVCSDSITFLNRAQQMERVFVIPGTVSHIDNDTVHDYQYYEKTFVDFYAIAHAEKVFVLEGGGLLDSGFPYAAARIGGRQVEKLRL